MAKPPRRVGIVGYGKLGKFLAGAIARCPETELAFVWNGSAEAFEDDGPLVAEGLVLRSLDDFEATSPDLVVEVCHPAVVERYGESFLRCCDFMLGSPTALADKRLEDRLRDAAGRHGLYVPGGALWGGDDVRKMSEAGTLKGLTVTMTKHPSCFKLLGDLKLRNERAATGNEPVVLYEGPVRGLCPLAPNNVNTMAAAAVAAGNLTLDGVIGRLVSDPRSRDFHVVEVEAFGPTRSDGRQFSVKTVRANPADLGAVTGSATFDSFLSSILRAGGKGPGLHLC